MTQLSEEQLQQIVETPAGERIRMKCGAADLRSVITDALSLLDSDSQAAKTFVGPCVSCGHNNYDAERKECKQRWTEGRMSVVCGCPCVKHNSLTNAATAMRDKCVETVSQILSGLMIEFSQTSDSYLRGQGWNSALARANNEVIPELQSLTLDQVKQEETNV